MIIGYCSSYEEQLEAKTINGSHAPPEAIRPGVWAEVWEGLLAALERQVAEDRLEWRDAFCGTLGQQSSDTPTERSTLVGRDKPEHQSQISSCVDLPGQLECGITVKCCTVLHYTHSMDRHPNLGSPMYMKSLFINVCLHTVTTFDPDDKFLQH